MARGEYGSFLFPCSTGPLGMLALGAPPMRQPVAPSIPGRRLPASRLTMTIDDSDACGLP